MSRNTSLIAFGTFGNPNGFKQTFFIGDNAEVAKSVKTFDLKTDAIRLFPKSRIYAVRKESVAGSKAISYSLYTYAKEQTSDRGGTFVGSGILYIDKIAEESDTIRCLNEFHDILISKNVQNDIIAVTHSDKFTVSKPASFEKLELNGREIDDIDFAQTFNKSLVIYSEVNAAKLQYLFKKSVDLLNAYDAVYFTPSSEVAEFVHQKGLFQLVQADGFEGELQKLQEERKQHIQSLVADYEKEKQKLEEDKKRVLDGWKQQIDANENIHRKNKSHIDEAKQEYSSLNKSYEGYEKSINGAVAQLLAGKKPDWVRQLHIENKRIFIESVNEQKQPEFISTLPKAELKTSVKPGFQQDAYASASSDSDSKRRHHKRRRLNEFKIISFVLLLLWAATLVYFLLFANTKKELEEDLQPKVQAPVVAAPASGPVVSLNPKPNEKLTGTALDATMKKIQPHASANDVVNIIFDNNPDVIRKVYAFQKEDYKKYLVEQNQEYFEKKDSSFYLKNDTLVLIPGYHVQK